MGQQQGDEMTTVRAPAWKWEWNLNTVVILVGFAGGLVAWGATWERLSSNQGAHARTLDQIDKRVTTLEASMRLLDNHELRITGVEKQAAEAATSMRAVENTLNNLSSDMRLVREILQRLEENGRGSRSRAP
ncbi:hypothetical protein GFB56_12445 [Ensifer sp. T173]|uniref:DUF2730 family protein n=2 Tax=Ensifer canadensis TaxID=555315 RepID=A0AAW4FHL0_9HYPH|nr:hypothetical protein [Ensifer canadensis]UBI74390.1 hypothetical protein J3R84_12910 [Ensifer canadensis]